MIANLTVTPRIALFTRTWQSFKLLLKCYVTLSNAQEIRKKFTGISNKINKETSKLKNLPASKLLDIDAVERTDSNNVFQ